jgi:hypothetical protein
MACRRKRRGRRDLNNAGLRRRRRSRFCESSGTLIIIIVIVIDELGGLGYVLGCWRRRTVCLERDSCDGFLIFGIHAVGFGIGDENGRGLLILAPTKGSIGNAVFHDSRAGILSRRTCPRVEDVRA